MQPLHCVSQHPVANLHLSTDQQHQMTTIMQPFQCDLPPQLQETHRTTRTQEQPLVANHIGGTIRDRNDPRRIRRTNEVPFIAGCSHFTRKNTRFRAPASSPKQSTRNIHAAITLCFAASRSKSALSTDQQHQMTTIMQPFQCDLPPQLQETHRTTHTQEQPLVANHIGGTIRDRNDPSRIRRTNEVPFIAGCSHFTRKNTRFRAPASSPKQSTRNIHAAVTLCFAASRSKSAPIYGPATPNDNNHAAIPMRSATTASRNA